MLTLLFTHPSYADIVGHAKVIDGDTIEVNMQRIRLFGVDAFELEQMCGKRHIGKEAADYLGSIIRNPVRCAPQGGRSYNRLVAICTGKDGIDIAQALVLAGFALADTTYSLMYLDDARSARQRGAGAHTQECQTPWAWRKRENAREGGRETPTPLRRAPARADTY